MQRREPTPRELAVTARLLPSTSLDGAVTAPSGSHDVVLLPGRAAVRIARDGPAAAALPRRTDLLFALDSLGLPFDVPRPLGPVVSDGELTAAAVSWIEGQPLPADRGDPTALRTLLDTLAAVDVEALSDVLDLPHAYAGRDRWKDLLLDEALPRLPTDLRASARRRIADVEALPPVTPRLVHGDLHGYNLHWSPAGTLLGIVDWDLASATDPAIDVACLADWHGWPTLKQAVDQPTYERARVWYGTFSIEQIVKAVLDDTPDPDLAACVEAVARWMRTDGLG